MICLLRHSAFGMLALSLLAASPFAAAASDEETIRALRDDNEWMRRQLEVQAQRLESESSLPVVDASGLWGQEDVDGVKNNIDQWGIGGHVVLPLTSWLSLKGEIQHGENLDAFLMGAGSTPATGTWCARPPAGARARCGPSRRPRPT